MPAELLRETLPDSRPLYRLIGRTRRLLRSSWVATGTGLTAALFFGSWVLVLLIDLTVPIPPWTWTVFHTVVPVGSLLRLAALLFATVPAVWALFTGVVRPLFRRMAAVQVARRIESHLPGIHNRLVSCIDLDQARKREGVSPVFHRRLLTEALDRIRNFRPHMVLDLLSLRRATLFGVATAISFVLLCCLFSSRVPRAMARLLFPFADLPPIADVRYSVAPGDAGVLREEPITFTARIDSETTPAVLHVELRGKEGQPYTFALSPDSRDSRRWSCTVDGGSLGAGYEDGFHYRVFGGGTWSQDHQIRLLERPVLVSITTAVYYPEYMGIPEPQPTPPQATVITGPEEGKVEVVVDAQGQVARAEIQHLRSTMRRLKPEEQTEQVWFESKAPPGSTQEGGWHWEQKDGQLAHSVPHGIGTRRHWFHAAPVGHTVGKGEVLFAWVYLNAEHPPEAIMLQWHDGSSWDHGAYWGSSRIQEGKEGSPSRRHVGPLPEAGKWVRLEVPDAEVGLEEKTLRGMAFLLNGGQCHFGRTGTAQVEKPSVEVVRSFPMQPREDGRWAGAFPLVGSGMFRAELFNEQGHTNKPMMELLYKAVPDRPPQVELQRQNAEMVLSQPAAVPLSISASDDYGLADLRLLLRKNDKDPYQERVLEKVATPERSFSTVASLKEAADLKQGEQFRYCIEARDRKGQKARTREYVLRIAADANAADQQLTQLEKSQDPLLQRLIDLIGKQKQVQQSVEKLHKEYAAVTEKAVQAEKKKEEEERGKPQGTAKPPEPLKLDPETARRLAELRQQLDKLAQQEKQNAAAAEQISKDFAQSIEQARKVEMLPKAIADQMDATQRTFQNMVADPLQDLGQRMSQAGDPSKNTAPDLPDLKQRSDRVQQEMEAIKNRMDALANARKGIREDLREALRQLQREMLQETAKLTERELQQLRDFLARMRQDMKNLENRQNDLLAQNREGEVSDLKRKQEDLEKDIEKMLAQARHLLDARRRMKDRPEFPQAPYTPEGKEVKVPPREEDTEEPLPGDKKPNDKGKPGDKKDQKEADKDDDTEPLYMPALAGERTKEDPRFAKKKRPAKPRSKKGNEKPEEADREQLQEEGNDRRDELQAAENSLGADQQTLEQMLQQLERSLSKPQGKQGKPGQQQSEADQMAEQLQQMMQSPAMRAAMAMAARMRQGMPQRGPAQPGQPAPPTPSQTPEGNRDGHLPGTAGEADLSRLDAETQAMILKLPPRLREDLLQGMNEQGVKAYQDFIRDYFKRLTQNRTPKGQQ